MIEAGITDPESLAGKRFCTHKCPYDHCVIAEPKITSPKVRTMLQKRAAKLLHANGKTIQEIADELQIGYYTIRNYLYR